MKSLETIVESYAGWEVDHSEFKAVYVGLKTRGANGLETGSSAAETKGNGTNKTVTRLFCSTILESAVMLEKR